jgi:phage gp36-like protein
LPHCMGAVCRMHSDSDRFRAMNYATQQDMIDRYSEDLLWTIAFLPADPDAAEGAPEAEERLDAVSIEKALSDASSECDVYLNARYEMPLPVVPPVLLGCCVDIAVYNLATGPGRSDEIKERYDRAIKLLDRISKGTADLGLPKAQKPAPGGGAGFVQAGRNDFGNVWP